MEWCVHVFVFVLSYLLHIINFGQYSLQMLKFGTLTKCVCIDHTEVTIGSLTLSTLRRTVTCFFINYIAVDCGTPRSLSNGQRRYSSTTFRSTVTYTCNLGYRMTSGSSSRTCQSNGQWSGTHLTCIGKSTLCHYISSAR